MIITQITNKIFLRSAHRFCTPLWGMHEVMSSDMWENSIQSVGRSFNKPVQNQYWYRIKLKLTPLIGNTKASLSIAVVIYWFRCMSGGERWANIIWHLVINLAKFKVCISFLDSLVAFSSLSIYIQDVTERCGQTLSTNSTYQNKKKCPYQHVSENI
jgi:hypothetical protein